MANDLLIDELRATITRLRAALAESMEWDWASESPPADVNAKCEAALTDDTPAPFSALSGNPQTRTHLEAELAELESI
jgi:hypothetical protein